MYLLNGGYETELTVSFGTHFWYYTLKILFGITEAYYINPLYDFKLAVDLSRQLILAVCKYITFKYTSETFVFFLI